MADTVFGGDMGGGQQSAGAPIPDIGAVSLVTVVGFVSLSQRIWSLMLAARPHHTAWQLDSRCAGPSEPPSEGSD